MAQNWNSLLKYIKRKLGVPVNLIELTDDDIYDIITDDVIPVISEYISRPVWIRLGPGDIKNGYGDSSYSYEERYILPTTDQDGKDIIIIEVREIYYPQYGSVVPPAIEEGLLTSLMIDPRDTAMANVYLDMSRHFRPVRTFQFLPPNELLIDMAVEGRLMIAECKAVHSDLRTIPSDIYNEIFKDMCLAEVIDNVVAMRKKYRSLSSPFGEIQINWEELQTQKETIKTTVQEKLDSMPPDHLIAFV